jgi:tetratricopeptide (TPR) repeat protein/class 3 adenylate cyclase
MHNLLPNFILDNYKNNKFDGELNAFTMFIDFSGFSNLTEKLMQSGSDGAEILSNILKNVFRASVNIVYESGGFISTFAGDAFTAIFPVSEVISRSDQAHNILTCADKILQNFKDEPIQKTKYGNFEFNVTIGIANGTIKWAIIGSKDKAFYFRGDAIDDCAKSESIGDKNEIIIHNNIKKLLITENNNIEQIKDNYFRIKDIKKASTVLAKAKTSSSHLDFTKEIFSKKFFPEAVFNVKEPGEFRNVISIFISYKGISELDEFNKFFTILIDTVNFFSGYIENFDFGDKGGVVPCFFGAPVSFEDNISRALNFTLKFRQKITLKKSLEHLEYRIGITHGKVYAGIVGGNDRCQYTMLGSKVNLAARFMMEAEWGDIWTDANIYNSLKDSFNFEQLSEQNLKGFKERIIPYKIIEEQKGEITDTYCNKMIGRDSEMKKMMDSVRSIFEGNFAGVIYVNGEIGIGKTRLMNEFRKKIESSHNICWLYCSNEEIIRQSLSPFKYLLTNMFKQSPDNPIDKNKRAFNREIDHLLKKLKNEKTGIEDTKQISNELERTRSILGSMVDLHWEGSLYEQLDPQLRFENTLFAFYNFVIANASLHPLIIEIEDAQWLDNDSLELLNVLARNIKNLPLAIIFSSRYLDDGSKFSLKLDEYISRCDIELGYLSSEGTKSLTEQILGDKVNETSVKFLKEKTNGNPYFVEQLVLDFKERGFWQKQKGAYTIPISNTFSKGVNSAHISAATEETIPSTINSVLLSRFDRLTAEIKEVVQTASVLGKEFDIPILYKILKDISNLKLKIKAAEKKQVWTLINEIKCVYRHALLRDVVYNMQMGAKLREIHLLAANSIMSLSGKNITLNKLEQYSYHFGIGNNVSNENNEITITKEQIKNENEKNTVKKYFTLQKKLADEYKKNYNNEKAIEKCNHVIKIATIIKDIKNEIEYKIKKGNILLLIGKFEDAIDVYQNALSKSVSVNKIRYTAQCNNALGKVYEDKGNYKLAKSFQEKAIKLFEETNDKSGTASCLGNLGDVFYEKGDYEKAMKCYNKQLLISRETGDKKGIHIAVESMGDIYKEQGDYTNALEYLNKSLKISEKVDDKIGIAMTIGNIGNVYYDKGERDKAIKYYEKQLLICENLGYKRGISAVVGNMGNIYSDMRNFEKALKYFERSLRILEELGDKAGISMMVGNMGNIYINQGRVKEAMKYYKKQLTTSKELGHKRGTSIALGNLGIVYTELGSYNQAKEYLERSLVITEELGSKRIKSVNLGNLGNVYREIGDYAKALKYYDKAIKICNEIGAIINLYHVLIEKADLLYSQKKYEKALIMVTKGLQIVKELGSEENIMRGKILLSKIEFHKSNKAKSIKELRELLETSNEENDIADLHYELYNLLNLYKKESSDEEQLKNHRTESLKLYKKLYKDTYKFQYKKRIEELLSINEKGNSNENIKEDP